MAVCTNLFASSTLYSNGTIIPWAPASRARLTIHPSLAGIRTIGLTPTEATAWTDSCISLSMVDSVSLGFSDDECLPSWYAYLRCSHAQCQCKSSRSLREQSTARGACQEASAMHRRTGRTPCEAPCAMYSSSSTRMPCSRYPADAGGIVVRRRGGQERPAFQNGVEDERRSAQLLFPQLRGLNAGRY